jgi:hypothetical protein
MFRSIKAKMTISKCCGVSCYWNLGIRCSRCDKKQPVSHLSEGVKHDAPR